MLFITTIFPIFANEEGILPLRNAQLSIPSPPSKILRTYPSDAQRLTSFFGEFCGWKSTVAIRNIYEEMR